MYTHTTGKKPIITTLLLVFLLQFVLVSFPTHAQTPAENPISDMVLVPLINKPGNNGLAGRVNPTNTTTTSGKPILNTLVGEDKQCPYIDKGLYKPFSNISTNFALFKGFNLDGSVAAGCLKVHGGMDQFILLLFKVFIGLCSVLAVIFIAVAGISMIAEQSNIQKKIRAKDMLWRALQGLLLSLVAWILLFTVNQRLVKFSVDEVFQQTNFQKTIAQGLSNVSNFDVIAAGGTASNYLQIPVAPTPRANPLNNGVGGSGMYPGYGVLSPDAEPNPYGGEVDANGATPIKEATIFGYRDGDGRTGWGGDNGVGTPNVTHLLGYTNYTGDPHSKGVAVPRSWLDRDFGGYSGAVNSAYALFKNGVCVGVFPIVDISTEKLDLTYGLVTSTFQAVLERNKADTDWVWDGTGISYKAMPGFWLQNLRPSNPMIEVKRIMGTNREGHYGMHMVGDVLPIEITKAIQEGNINVIRQ